MLPPYAHTKPSISSYSFLVVTVCMLVCIWLGNTSVDDGHITNRITVLATNDEEAIGHARHLVDVLAVELRQARHITKFDPKDRPSWWPLRGATIVRVVFTIGQTLPSFPASIGKPSGYPLLHLAD